MDDVGSSDVGRLAVIADIHGNIPALEAVLADLGRFEVDAVVCLGDVANGGPEPAAALARLRRLNAPTALGNTDASLLAPRTPADLPTPPPPGWEEHLEVEAWCAAQLGEAEKDYIRTFHPYLELTLAGLRVVAYHGSPKRFDDHVRSFTPDERLAELLDDTPAEIYLGAHTHEQFAKRYRGSIVMNPGSVGMAVRLTAAGEGWYPAAAEYALVNVLGGQPSVHLRKVAYDLGRLQGAVKRSGMPHGDAYLARFFRSAAVSHQS
ncbi:MAG: metallophosphatase family protein [Trueperaceae bacterium]|nr:metallophosphoesterase family protein [Trueperaceae bacterium]MCO5174870.1 metallophosphatase family protein [Trueperaceae bacterium]MCW5820619.1 metallophosphoesterase family protein [Trueperaceae bacterium]